MTHKQLKHQKLKHQQPDSPNPQQQSSQPHSQLHISAERLAQQLKASEERHLHPMSWLFILWDNIFQLLIVVFVIMFQADDGLFSELLVIFPWMGFIVPVIIILLVSLPIFHFLSYRFQIVNGEIRIRWGILSKQQRHIPLNKIHNVGIRQNLLHRLLQVAEVRLESAGSGQESEAKLRVLSLTDALLLESTINRVNSTDNHTISHAVNTHTSQPVNSSATHATATTNHSPYQDGVVSPLHHTLPQTLPQQAVVSGQPTKPIFQLPDNDILRYGLISNSGVALGGVLTLIMSPERIISWLMITFGVDIPEELLASGDLLSLSDYLLDGQSWLMQVLIWLAVSIGLLLSVFIMGKIYSVITAFVQLYDYKLVDTGHNLSVEKGLLTRHKSNIPLDKIQVWRVEETWLHRLFNRQTLQLDTAILVNPQQKQKTERGISELLPVAEPKVIEQMLNNWRQPFPEEYEFHPVHPKAFNRILFRWLCLIAVVVLVLCLLLSQYLALWSLMAGGMAGFAWVASRKRADYMGVMVNDSHLMWRDGWLNRVCYIAEIKHAHALAVTDSPFDRRYGMASLIVDTVGGTLLKARITMPYLPYEIAQEVAEIVKVRC